MVCGCRTGVRVDDTRAVDARRRAGNGRIECQPVELRGPMSISDRLLRFARKSPRDQLSALGATLASVLRHDPARAARRRFQALLTGPNAPPKVLQGGERFYVAYRPDADVAFHAYPEIAQLSEKWIAHNLDNNAGDLPRLYSLVLNIKNVLDTGIAGDLAELGVYRGNSAAVLAYYARLHGRNLVLFDTFEGFDKQDLVGADVSKHMGFSDTLLDLVRQLVGGDGTQFVKGRFPQSVPSELHNARFCLAHIDCDLYEPMKASLDFFYPRLSAGGLLILHDYANPHWDGIKRAVDEFCATIPERPVLLPDKSGTAVIRKCGRNK